MAKKILLTGAGFTHNFGAPLSADVSNLIFNSVTSTELRDILREDFDYENIYQRVLQSQDYSPEIKHELSTAISYAYNKIDKLISKNISESVDQGRLIDFIKWFDKKRGGGFIFTLNQDLFIENNTYNQVFYELPPTVAVVSPTETVSNSHDNPLFPKKINYIIGDSDIEKTIEEFDKQFKKDKSSIYYIKMHGSQNWIMSDNRQVMIIGHGKADRIKANKLLNWYSDIFDSQLAKNSVKLLIIGYSFGDKHINEAIYKNRNNVSLYIVNPQSIKDFSEALNSKPLGSQIFTLIKKYYPRTFADLLGPHNGTPHIYWEELKSEFM